MPHWTIIVEVQAEKVNGKFVAKDEMESEIVEAIEGADPGSLMVDESEYEITEWEVQVSPA